jgi:hypothetical protein
MAEIKVTGINSDKKFVAGVSTQIGSLYLLIIKAKEECFFKLMTEA